MNKKVLNFLLSIIVILIVIIFACAFYIFSQARASSSILDDIKINSTTTNANNEETAPQTVSFDNTKVQKIYPFTGAFSSVDIIPFIFDNVETTEFSNEEILRLGFAKVTKEDWAHSYIAEGEPVSISAGLLDKYIKDIFGENVQYTKTDFSNANYSIDKDYASSTSSYTATYVKESDTYVINHTPGDGIDENFIYLLKPSTAKIQGNFDIEIPYVFIEVADELLTREVDGVEQSTFEYIVYTNCDYETKTFSGEIGRFSEFDENETFVVSDIIENICNKHLSEIQKLQLIYESNEDKTAQILREIK